MRMGQVWLKADVDGGNVSTHRGGHGSVLAVTTQNAGPDGLLGTADDVTAPLNPLQGVQVSSDRSYDRSCQSSADRVRNFTSRHTAGANFLFADGSVRLIRDGIDFRTYQALSTIRGGEAITGGY